MAGGTYGKEQQELNRKVEELLCAVDAVRDYAYETNPARARVLDGRGAFDFHAEKEKKR